ncbi:MAG: agmatine deiminase family protein, partial [Ignavibacteria bacterium]|nr:agmatine deiminase family protein [Ignavibacteria bacterium]
MAQVAVFNPAEFEKNEGVLLVWDYNAAHDSITANITKIAQQAGKVWILYRTEMAAVDTTQIKNYLFERGVLPENLFFLPTNNESLWIRDFGPMTLYGNFGQDSERFIIDMGFSAYNRPMDDSVPAQIASQWGWQKTNFDLEVEGGNIMFDGLMRGFSTKRVYEQNPDLSPALIRNIFIDKFNQNDFTFLEPLNYSGGGIWKHVDMFMKVLDYETILVSSYPDYLPDFPVIEGNVSTLESLNNAFSKPYNIIRIPAPPKADGTWATTQDDEMRTYTNSLIINNNVIVPSYGLPEYDTQAMQIYQNVMPGYKIIMVDAQNLTPVGGSIHSITKEVPAPNLVRVVHKKVTGRQEFASDFHIYSNCESSSILQRMWLYYKVNQDENYTKVPVYLNCPQNIGIIEGLNPGDTVKYYLEAISINASTTYPLAAPAGNFTFFFDEAVNVSENFSAKKSDDLLVFPLPNDGNFYVKAKNDQSISSIRILNSSGQVVYNEEYISDIQINAQLNSGF